jgi:hypothetical protein
MKYGDEVGSKCHNCPLFECKLMSRRASLGFTNMFLSLYNKESCHFIFWGHMWAHVSSCSSHTCDSPNGIKLMERTQNFHKVLLSWKREKGLSLPALLLGLWHKCWKWQIWEILQETWVGPYFWWLCCWLIL